MSVHGWFRLALCVALAAPTMSVLSACETLDGVALSPRDDDERSGARRRRRRRASEGVAVDEGRGSQGALAANEPSAAPSHASSAPGPARAVGVRRLPFSDPERVVEINRTLDLIEEGGPYPFRQDGTIFHNREGRLPARPFGAYREYTVVTPGLTHRGPRRIVTGPPPETWYSDDHYRSFIQIDPRRY